MENILRGTGKPGTFTWANTATESNPFSLAGLDRAYLAAPSSGYTGPATASLEASFDGGTTWHTAKTSAGAAFSISIVQGAAVALPSDALAYPLLRLKGTAVTGDQVFTFGGKG